MNSKELYCSLCKHNVPAKEHQFSYQCPNCYNILGYNVAPKNSIDEILDRISEIHKRKSADYAQEGNRWSNFERAAVIGSWFNDPVDKIFITLIGVKLARLAELLNGKTPKNESVDDSFLDLCTYCVLWMDYNQQRTEELLKKQESEK